MTANRNGAPPLTANGNGARPMTIPEVAREAGVSKAAVYRWIADGKLPSYRFPGAGKTHAEILRVARKDFEAFLKGCYVQGPL